MSFAIEFGYQTILSTFNSKIINAALIELGLREAILRTDKEWLGPPGIISGIIDTLSGDFELINSGQPVPIIFSGGVTSELSTRKQDDPSINRGNTVESVSKNLSSLKPGDALALVSDGFLELFSQVSGQHFVERFNKAAKAFKGDSRAILTNILSAINKELVINSGLVKDDATIMLISRVREK